MTFEYPIVFILALVMIPLMLFWAYRMERRKQKLLTKFIAPTLVDDLTRSVSKTKKQIKAALFALGIAFIGFAAARPQYGYVWNEVKSKGIDVVFAIDTSKSMLAQDIRPNRLERSKLAVLDFIDRMGNDRIGLVAFAGSAFLQCPLTLDYNAFRQSLAILEPGIIPVGGTDIATAIQVAESAFKKENSFKILILITDGEDLEQRGIGVARDAASRGVKIFTLGVGSAEGEIIPIINAEGKADYIRDSNGAVVRTRLDVTTLQQIARASNGFYSPLGPLGEGLDAVYQLGLEDIPRQELNARMNKEPIERFHWPLAIGMLFLVVEWLIGTRRTLPKATPAMLALGLTALFISAPTPAEASPYEAQSLFRKNKFVEAEKAYRQAIVEEPEDMKLRYNLANTLYREGKYEDALTVYEQALKTDEPELQADILYNMGNAWFRIGEANIKEHQPQTRKDWAKALENYQGSLVIQPEDNDAGSNLDYLKYRIESLIMFDLVVDSNFPDAVELEGSGNFDQGIKRSISVKVKDEDHFRFVEWQGEGVDEEEKTKNKITLLMNDHKHLTAQLIERVRLTVIVQPEIAGTSDSGGIYDKGEEIDLKFESSFSWRFVKWDGEGVIDPTTAETKLVIDQDMTVIVICDQAYELEFITEDEE